MSKALFLDRDGVINYDYGHVHTVDKLKFIDGIFDLTSYAQNLEYQIFIVTNQAGIAKGYYTEEEFQQFKNHIETEFMNHNIKITKTYYCPHHPEYTGPCLCRKPEPGMLIKAINEYNINPSISVLIGDNITDIAAADRAGINTKVLYNNNKITDKFSIYQYVNGQTLHEIKKFL